MTYETLMMVINLNPEVIATAQTNLLRIPEQRAGTSEKGKAIDKAVVLRR
jgi:hypothetical protein